MVEAGAVKLSGLRKDLTNVSIYWCETYRLSTYAYSEAGARDRALSRNVYYRLDFYARCVCGDRLFSVA